MPDGRRTSSSAGANCGAASTPGPGPRPGPKATNHPGVSASTIAYTTISDRHAEPADAANPSPDTRPVFLPEDLEYPAVTAPTTLQDTDPQHPLAASSTDAAPAASYILGLPSFGSEPWGAPSGLFLDFAPQPIYEPTGELLHEHIHTFDEFDAPSISRYTTTALSIPPNNPPPPPPLQPPPPDAAPANNAAVVATTTNGTVSVTAFVQPSLPRSALKRKASSLATTPTESPVDKKTRALSGIVSEPGSESATANSRSVTFERMSGIGPTSPDEGSTSSELPGGRAVPSVGAPAGNRRTRQSSGSTPRPTVNPQTASSQGSTRARGTRTSSGHPPSILPPEKVFPIQIGSDLFRLSGASISSDGKLPSSSTMDVGKGY